MRGKPVVRASSALAGVSGRVGGGGVGRPGSTAGGGPAGGGVRADAEDADQHRRGDVAGELADRGETDGSRVDPDGVEAAGQSAGVEVAACFVVLHASPWWALSPVALLVALVGFLALMPPGTGRLRHGSPAALAGLTLFGAGYFGANGLVTLLFTQTYDATLFQAGIALSAAPIAWALASLLAAKLGAQGVPPAWGLTLTTAGVAVMAVLGLAGGPWVAALIAWTLSGSGSALPTRACILRATTEGPSLKATQLAAAVITTESFGGLIGSSAGAALASVSGSLGISRGDALAFGLCGLLGSLGRSRDRCNPIVDARG